MLDAAFGRPNEGRLVNRLRQEGLIVTSLVAIENGCVVGSIVFSDLPASTPTGTIAAVALAPMAVLAEHRRRGIGTKLANEGLRLCKDQGRAAAFVLGDPVYYRRFGFTAKIAEPIRSPYSGPSWMATELVEGALRGIEGSVTYPDAFAEVD